MLATREKRKLIKAVRLISELRDERPRLKNLSGFSRYLSKCQDIVSLGYTPEPKDLGLDRIPLRLFAELGRENG